MQRLPSLEGNGTTPGTTETGTLSKAATGIAGLDTLTGGGLPRGRTTLVCGATGSGKTLLALEFLVRGALEAGEPGVFVAFEERADELAANVTSLGFDLPDLIERDLLRIDDVRIDPGAFPIGGAFDLEGLFIRLGHAIDQIGATRVAIDTVEVLFGSVGDDAVLRAELGRLSRWLKERGVTAVITRSRSRRRRSSATYRPSASTSDGGSTRVCSASSRRVPPRVKTGSARLAHEARERHALLARRQEVERAQRELELYRTRHAAARAELDAELAAHEARVRILITRAEAVDGPRGDGPHALERHVDADARTLGRSP